MATEVIKTTFQFRRGKAATWASTNPVLAAGEPGWEKDTNRLKIGDGTAAWNDLPYFGGTGTIEVDGDSISIVDGVVALPGFRAAGKGYLAMKDEEGKLAWTNKISVELLDVPAGTELIIQDQLD